jgi:hypothetical protein
VIETNQSVTELAASTNELKWFQTYCKTAAARNFVQVMYHFQYELQTFTEKRETSWKFIPYSGGEVDGAENGPAPLPWDINAQPSDVFKNEEKFIRVPHTSSVKSCHRCRATGHIVCTECYGKGWVCIMFDIGV